MDFIHYNIKNLLNTFCMGTYGILSAIRMLSGGLFDEGSDSDEVCTCGSHEAY
jgi:hypothetical protein